MMNNSGAIDLDNQIAVIGMAGRFPGAKNLAEYWRNLRNGVESISFFTDQELTAAGVGAAALKDPSYIKAGGVLDGIELFDADFFGVNPREAEVTDPQQRLFLEVAWEALEEAGYDVEKYEGSIGVFAGAGMNTYWMNLLDNNEVAASPGGKQLVISNDKDYLSTLVSYKLNLKGPSLTVQTACSTSLVAVHLACQSLINGECDIALAGGSRIKTQQIAGYYYQEGGISSSDGHCRAFDAKADGCNGGSGVGIVVMKRLPEALRDRDIIHAVIRGSAINNDGSRKVGYTAPSVSGQAEVISEALTVAGIQPEGITYVEAHGTGTPLGDPIEVKALTQVFRDATSQRGFCAIGSVKTNIGHLDAAAGVAGLIKTILALKHQLLPPSLNYIQPNPLLDLHNSPFYVNTSLAVWRRNGSPRRAGVSSFGIGGTNAHVILEEAPTIDPSSNSSRWKLMLLSAKTGSALEKMTENLTGYLNDNPEVNLADVAYTCQVGRKAFKHRRALVCRDVADAVKSLETMDPRRILTGAAEGGKRRVVMMFSGQGTQYANMGLGLYRSEKVFRQEVDRSAGLLQPHLGFDLRQALYPREDQITEADEKLTQTFITQPALFVIEYALARWFQSLGVEADAMIGHSIGEYVAACLSGVFSLEDALRLVAARGSLMQGLPGGAMLAVQIDEKELQPWLNEKVSLAALNGPSLCVISGPHEAIDAAQTELTERNISCRRLHTSHAFHSSMMEPILQPFIQQLEKVSLKAPQVPYISNVTGAWITEEQATDPGYWVRHLRETVRFSDGLGVLLRDSDWIFLEVGPGQILSGLTAQRPECNQGRVVLQSLRHQYDQKDNSLFLLNTLGKLWLSGVEIDWRAFYEQERRNRVSLPTYPFESRRYWIEAKRGRTAERRSERARIVKGLDDWFYTPSWKISALSSGTVTEEWKEAQICLVFIDEYGLGARLAEGLRLKGKEVVRVSMGEQLREIEDGLYELNPEREEDYQKLLARLAERGKNPSLIAHLWGMTQENDSESGVELFRKMKEKGFNSLLYIARALAKCNMTKAVRLAVICNQLQDVSGAEMVCAENAIMLGPCMVIPQEYANVECRCVDVVIPKAGSAQATRLNEQLLDEMSSATTDVFVAYRGRQRWVQTFEWVELGAEEAVRPLRERGVYLITGGLGGVGLLLAEYLARSVRATLILVGRRGLPRREEWENWIESHGDDDAISAKIRRVRAMEAIGSHVEVISVDVANEQEMQSVMARIDEDFGQLHGVLHAAGTAGAMLIEKISQSDCERQFEAKVYGLYVLEKVLKGREVDFCLLFSSNASVLGGLGYIAYAAANRFMDSFAAARNGQGRNCWISSNWDGWLMSDMAEQSGRVRTGIDQYAMWPKESCEAFRRIVTGEAVSQVIVSRRDLPSRYNTYIKRESTGAEEAAKDAERGMEMHSRPALGSSYVAPTDELERRIVGIWQELLGIEPVGVEDNFFELRGHSLVAMQLVSRIRSILGVELSLRSLFEEPTVRGISVIIRGRMTVGVVEKDEERAPIVERRECPLSFAQQRLWFIHKLEPYSFAYNILNVVRLRGNFNISVLQQSLNKIALRHLVLRTRFEVRDGQPLQVIDQPSDVVVPLWDVKGLTQDKQTEVSREIATREVRRPFNLEKGPVWRANVVKVDDDDHLIVMCMHHVVSDGWSAGILVKEMTALYEGYSKGEKALLPELTMQYADFAVWQRDWLQGEALEEQLGYWRKQLSGALVLELPTDRPRPAAPSYRGAKAPFRLSAELTRELGERSRREGVTLFMTLLGAFQSVLGRYAGQDDVVVGTDVANRNRLETEGLIGFFINQLVLRTDLSGNPSLRELLRRVRETTLGAYTHQDLPFEKLVEEMSLERDLNRSPFFQVKLVLENTPGQAIEIPGLQSGAFEWEDGIIKLSMNLMVQETANGVTGSLNYSTDLFEFVTAKRIVNRVVKVLEAVVSDIEQRIDEIELLSPGERQQVVLEWNDTERKQEGRLCVHELFERQAAEMPDAVAVVYEDEQISYGALNEEANRLARYLVRLGVGSEVRVALCMERGLEVIIGLLGTLKAGGAYVPIDPRHPAPRVLRMLEDSQAAVALTQERLRGSLPAYWAQEVMVDSERGEWAEESGENLRVGVMEENLAYVIYTSGSTGWPKGVGIEHRQLVNYVVSVGERLKLEAGWRMGLISTITADLGHTMLYPSLCFGGELHVVSEERGRDMRKWGEYRSERELECLKITPTHLEGLVESGAGMPSKKLVLGGEICSRELIRRVKEWGATCEVINHYGPTECTVGVVTHDVNGREGGSVPIGKALGNVRAYVVDRKMAAQPARGIGELLIGGEGVGRGYLNDAGMTAEKFAPDWMSGQTAGRVYRTGDQVRWGDDGELEYLGRIDQQVKIRGHRIELREIESALGEHPGVKQCAVCVQEDERNGKRLVGYVAPSVEGGISVAELREYLLGKLPEYMAPVVMIEMKELPLTPNGKLDRKALPAPVAEERGAEAERARTVVEEIVAGIWEEVLRRERIGLRENFFELGGHSLLATQVISRIRDTLGVELALRAIFESPTVEGLTEAVEWERRAGACVEAPPMVTVSRERELPLSYAQQRLWFIQQLDSESAAYNVPRVVRIQGKFSFWGVCQSLGEVERRHEVLRTRIESRDGRAFQVIDEAGNREVGIWDVSGLKVEERERLVREVAGRESRRPFDLEKGPVWRANMVKVDDDDHFLVMCMHHVVSDGWSAGILVKEMTALYEGYSKGEKALLPELTVQYADFAVWQRDWLQGEALEEQLSYWRKQLSGAPVLELPTDRPRPAAPSHRGGRAPFRLSAELSEGLREVSRREGVTLFMTLLGAFQLVLGRYAGQDDVVVGTDVANRNRLESEGLIGFFINQLVLRTDLSGNPSLRELLRRVRETTLGAYTHQDLPFEKLVEEMSPERDLSRAPLFQVKLVLQNAPQATLRVGGVEFSGLGADHGAAKFDLTLSLSEDKEGVWGIAEYATDLYDAASVERMLSHLKLALGAMVADPEQRIGYVRLMTAPERQMLAEWNDTECCYYENSCAHELFEQQVERTPDAVAVVGEEGHFSYAALNDAANQLARYLSDLGVGAETRVGLCMERGLEMASALLAVLKAGGAYVPLDPSYPLERLSFMIEDAQVLLLLTQSNVRTKLPNTWVQCIELDCMGEIIGTYDTTNRRIAVSGSNTAYIIYTSGSTGRPKGVALTRMGMVNLAKAQTTAFGISAGTVVLQFASLSFDASVSEYMTALLTGAKLALGARGEILAGDALRELLEREQVEVATIPPSVLASVPIKKTGGPWTLVVAGEACPEILAREWVDGRKMLNAYGPTEATVCATISGALIKDKRPLIGRPIANTRVFVVDKWGQATPVGVAGDLLIGGAGLAQCYLNQPALTAESFVPDEFSGDAGGRLYRTGDVVKWRVNGELDYLGRRDDQVKIRGHRIELSEVQSALSKHTLVKQCAVRAQENEAGEKQLVAYVAASGEVEPTTSELREYLQRKLPEYMIPSAYVGVQEFPLTSNGKLDVKALARLRNDTPDHATLPRDSTELQLHQIWSDVLQTKNFGILDNFFDLGGNSLSAVILSSRVGAIYGKNIGVGIIFDHPTIQRMAAYLRQEVDFTSPSTVVPLQPGGRRRPLFLVHSAGGLVHPYIPLARCLDPDQPFYGLQSFEPDCGSNPSPTVEEMAARYVAAIREIQPTGPYQIGGYSFGGIVAFEMAQQLNAAGEKVSTLVMLDAMPPLEHVDDKPLAEEEHEAKVRELLISRSRKLGLGSDEVEVMPINELLRQNLRYEKDLGDKEEEGSVAIVVTEKQYLQLWRNMVTNAHAAERYRPKAYAGRITLFRTSGQSDRDPDYGWGQWALGGVEVHYFDAEHLFFVSSPNAPALAAGLSNCIAAADCPA